MTVPRLNHVFMLTKRNDRVLIQIRQPKDSTTVIRLTLFLPMATASYAAAWELRQTAWECKATAMELGVLSEIAWF